MTTKNQEYDYGTAPTPMIPVAPKKPVMDGRQRVEVITNVTIGIVIMVVVALILSPVIYYVANVVPKQQQQMHDLRIECLAHHTVEACMELTRGGQIK